MCDYISATYFYKLMAFSVAYLLYTKNENITKSFTTLKENNALRKFIH